jgi:hypothetical protein
VYTNGEVTILQSMKTESVEINIAKNPSNGGKSTIVPFPASFPFSLSE